MRRTRILAACLLALALVPGTCVRTEPPVSFNWGPFTMRPVTTQPVRMGPFVAQAAWEIVSRNFWDGGYSALVATGPGKLLAATDSGRFLAIAVEGGLPVAHGAGSVDDRPPSPGPQKKAQQDIESLARDPATGTLWAGHEYTNRIERYSDRLRFRGGVAPPGMAGWGQNSGAEAFVRLADGRFLAVEERARDGGEGRHRALLFPSDPLDGATPRPLVFIAPDGFRPVDMTPIGGGRVLVLYRGVGLPWPSPFRTAIGIASLDRIGARGEIRPVLLARFDSRVPQDNYEGIAVTDGPQGRFVWLIADNNHMQTQRSLLLKLRWEGKAEAGGPERQKARE